MFPLQALLDMVLPMILHHSLLDMVPSILLYQALQ